MIGSLGPYELIERIGQGGMGSVYRARDSATGREVALKLITGIDDDPLTVERFAREVQAAARIAHPNVVRLLHYDTAPHPESGRTTHYYSMDLIDGGSLADVLTERTLPPIEAIALGARVARGLGAAHRLGIVHRDVKPSNILLDAGGEPYIADFGLARVQEVSRSLTRSGVVVGTPVYMAPEQADGGAITPACDVWSTGAVLYQAIGGEPVRSGISLTDLVVEALTRDPRPLSSMPGVQVSGEIDLVLRTCLERDPARRYADGDALADELERLLRGEPIQARPPGRLYRLRKWIGRNQAASVLVFASLLAIGGVSGASWLRARRAELLARRFAEGVVEQQQAYLRDLSQAISRAADLPATDRLQRRCTASALRRALDEWSGRPEWAALEARWKSEQMEGAAAVKLEPLAAKLHFRRAEIEKGFDERVAEYARAWCADPTSATGRRAAFELGRRYFERGRHQSAAGVFANLLGRFPQTAEGRKARTWLGRALLRLGRFDQARALLPAGDAETVLAGSLLPVRLLPGSQRIKTLTALACWRPRDDEPPLLVLGHHRGLAIYRPPFDGPPVEAILGPVYACLAADVDGDGRRELVCQIENKALAVLDWREKRAHLRWSAPASIRFGKALIRLPGPGPVRLLAIDGGAQPVLLTLSPSGFTKRPYALPHYEAAGNWIGSYAARDGMLYVGVGPWSAFDLRAFRLDRGTPPRPVERVARRLIGEVESLVLGRFLDRGLQLAALVNNTPDYRLPRIFGADLRRLVPSGVYLFDAAPQAGRPWDPVRKLEVASWRDRRVGLGGLQALRVAQTRPWLCFWSQPSSPPVRGAHLVRFEREQVRSIHLPDRWLSVAGDLDGDGDDELIERGGEGGWLLRGLGRTTTPTPALPAPAPLPALQGDALALPLAREMIGLELWSAAQGLLEELSASGAPALRRQARPLLLEVLVARERWDRAAKLAGELGDPTALARLARIARLRGEWTGLEAALGRLADSRSAAPAVREEARREQRRLARFHARRLRWRLDFARGLPPGGPLDHPLGLRREAGRGLVLVGQPHTGPALPAWPLQLDGGPFELVLRLRLERLDWAASFEIGLYLVSGDQAIEAARVNLGRQGMVTWNNVQGPTFIREGQGHDVQRGDRLIAPANHTLRLRWPGPGYDIELLWQVDRRPPRRMSWGKPALLPRGRYELRIVRDEALFRPGFCAVTLLRSIELLGTSDECRLLPATPPDRRQAAHRAFIEGRFAEAAEGYEALLQAAPDALTGLLAGLAWRRAGQTERGLDVALRHWSDELYRWIYRRYSLVLYDDLSFVGKLMARRMQDPGQQPFLRAILLAGRSEATAELVKLLADDTGFHEDAIRLAQALRDDPRAVWFAAWAHFRLDRYAEALRLYQSLLARPGVPKAAVEQKIQLCRWRIKVTR